MPDTAEVKAVENDAKATEAAIVPVVETVAHDAERSARERIHALIDEAKGDLSKGWAWLKEQI